MSSTYVKAQLPNNGYLIINSAVVECMKTYTQYESHHPESGGVLIGKKRPPHIEITSLTEPTNGDFRERFGFIRKDCFHIKEVFRKWIQSSRKETYIGEWHTHPEDYPQPSAIDLAEWKFRLRDNSQLYILIILGRKGIWVGQWQAGSVVRLKIISDD